MCVLAATRQRDIAVRNFSMKRKATMRNRRLKIFPLAIILMTACGDSTAIEPEMIDMTGTWLVQTWTVTRVSDGLQVDMLADTSAGGGGVTDSGRYFYDDGTLLGIVNFPDTAATNQSVLPDSTFLDASEYPLQTWCVSAVDDIEFCTDATSTNEIIVDAADADSPVWVFVRSGDDLTLNADTTTAGGPAYLYDFAGAPVDSLEAATFVQTLDRVLVDYGRCDLTDFCGR
jgi:hypothetical protein